MLVARQGRRHKAGRARLTYESDVTKLNAFTSFSLFRPLRSSLRKHNCFQCFGVHLCAAPTLLQTYNAARVQPLDHPAFTYPAIEEIAAAQEDTLRRPDNPPALGAVPLRLESQAQDRIDVGDAMTINGRTTRRTERGIVEVDVTSVQGKRYLLVPRRPAA
jgi:hypothetical protein